MLKSKPNKVLTPWLGLDDKIDLTRYAGFLYLITEIKSGRQYLGKRMLWRNLRVKVKGKKRRKKVKLESDWRYYKSSSDEILAGIRKNGLQAYRFEILSLHKTRTEVNYTETKELFKREVLHSKLPSGEYTYMNRNIGGKWYRGKV